jgi:hypothetical protein
VKGEGCRIHVAGYMMQDTGYRIQEKSMDAASRLISTPLDDHRSMTMK